MVNNLKEFNLVRGELRVYPYSYSNIFFDKDLHFGVSLDFFIDDISLHSLAYLKEHSYVAPELSTITQVIDLIFFSGVGSNISKDFDDLDKVIIYVDDRMRWLKEASEGVLLDVWC